jgi:hypothetical protein
MNEVSQPTKKLIEKYIFWQKSLRPKEGVATIHVDEVASRVAAFYEQIRTIIDWKEEHLMRRTAIMRKLKARFIDLEMNESPTDGMAGPLVLELIRGGYFPNNKIEELKIQEIQRILNKYIFILENSPARKQGKAAINFYNNVLEVAACEIEETLIPSIREMALIEYMFVAMQERIKVNENVYTTQALEKEEKDIQIYIAVQQALFKFDEPMISYNLIKYKFPFWDNPSQDELLKLAQNMDKVLRNIEKDIEHPLAKKFYAICEKYDTPYLLLGDILMKDNIEEINQEINDPARLENVIRGAYSKRLKDLKAKITRAAIYSTASIFITKILALIILQWALSWVLNEHSSPAFFVADILIPTTLMALLVLSVRPPSKKNLNLAIIETMKIIYKKEKIDSYDVKVSPQRGFITRLVLSFAYLTGACISFGSIYLIFYILGFPITSIAINMLFIALVLFAGTAIQKRSQELTIEEESHGMVGFISDVLFLPIAGLGSWMSKTWKQYNAIATFFNALIDMPFSTFVEFLERWRYFIQEKKDAL